MVYTLTDSNGTAKITWYDPTTNTTVTDQFIVNESQGAESAITPFPRFGSASDDTDAFDFGGVVRTITISAVKVDSIANIATFIQNVLLPMQNGDQSPDNNYPFVYNSDLLGAVKVKILSISGTYSAGKPIRYYPYTIKLVECSEAG